MPIGSFITFMSRQLSLFDFLPGPLLPSGSRTEKKETTIPQPGKIKAEETSKFPLSLKYAEVLVNYLPEGSVEDISNKLAKHNVSLKITKKRHTKLGDYRSPRTSLRGSSSLKENTHRITINQDLNKYSFLLTMIHELAHLTTWEKYKRKAKPHGAEWKQEFREIMLPFIAKKNFPDKIVSVITNYLLNPAASNCTDTALLKALRNYDNIKCSDKPLHLEEISENAVFCLSGSKKLLIKGKKLRKRFLCNQVNSKRRYLVSPVAEVIVINH